MRLKSLFVAAFIAVIALSPICAQAQTNFKQLPVTVEAYVKPFPPLKISGSTAARTAGLAVAMIAEV